MRGDSADYRLTADFQWKRLKSVWKPAVTFMTGSRRMSIPEAAEITEGSVDLRYKRQNPLKN